MNRYKLIQLTNTAVPAVDADQLLPLGTVTRRLNATTCNADTFQVASSLADTIYINEPGYYKITYSATLTAAGAGLVGVSLIVNNNAVYTVAEEATAAEDIVNITLPYIIRVCPNSCATPYNCPTSIQLKLGDVAIGTTPSPSSANLIVEKVY